MHSEAVTSSGPSFALHGVGRSLLFRSAKERAVSDGRDFIQEITKLYGEREREREHEREARRIQAFLSPKRGPRLSNISLESFRTSTKYRDRPAAADIAFCVTAYANGMT
jgi:hypothetical protein